MTLSTHTFRFTLFGGNVKMFREGDMGIVIEKEPQAVCVYGTDSAHKNILCAIPLGSPKPFKGLTYTVDFRNDRTALVSVGNVTVCIDFASHTCANNAGLDSYGSEAWGREVSRPWGNAFIGQ